jgi:hypothetical protein
MSNALGKCVLSEFLRQQNRLSAVTRNQPKDFGKFQNQFSPLRGRIYYAEKAIGKTLMINGAWLPRVLPAGRFPVRPKKILQRKIDGDQSVVDVQGGCGVRFQLGDDDHRCGSGSPAQR